MRTAVRTKPKPLAPAPVSHQVPAVVDLDAHRIRAGQVAWTRIKETAEDVRGRWREIGTALLIGRHRNIRDTEFGKWCKAHGFDMDASVRSNAMWFAQHFEVCGDHNPGDTHPDNIRAAWRRAAKARKAAEEAAKDLAGSDIEDAPAPTRTETVGLDKATAVKVNKLWHRSQTGDEGSPGAERNLAAYARKHGMTVPELLVASAQGDPDGFFRFEGNLQQELHSFRAEVQTVAANLEKNRNITRDAIKAILIDIANSL